MSWLNRWMCSVSRPVSCPLPSIISGIAIALILLSNVAVSDTVRMKDGRSFEGMVVSQDESSVVIDTMVSGIRAPSLRLSVNEIEEVQTGPVSDGFFNTEPSPPPRTANAVTGPDRDGLYLVVPIKGELGTDVVADGIGRTISYAKRYRIQHLVFVVDSPGGDLDEVLMITRSMRRADQQLTFHAIIRRCQGAALAIPLLCETLHVEPGALIGDTEQALGVGSRKYGNEDDQVLRTELARRAFEYAVSNGSPGVIVRAMLDPLESLSAWKETDGRLGMAMALPEDIPTENVIFTTKAGEMLVLDYQQITAIGVPALEGGVAGLGAALGIDHWQAESDFGKTSMAQLVGQKRKQQASKDARFKQQLKANILKRETTQASIEHSIMKAMEWDPTEGDYATYTKRYRRGWGDRGRRSDDHYYAPGTNYTRESRNERQRRSDLTMGYLRKAAKACKSMKRFDAEAVKLGLEPTYNEGELDTMIQDMDTKYQFVEKQRNRRGQ
jgi:hypothetical protein